MINASGAMLAWTCLPRLNDGSKSVCFAAGTMQIKQSFIDEIEAPSSLLRCEWPGGLSNLEALAHDGPAAHLVLTGQRQVARVSSGIVR